MNLISKYYISQPEVRPQNYKEYCEFVSRVSKHFEKITKQLWNSKEYQKHKPSELIFETLTLKPVSKEIFNNAKGSIGKGGYKKYTRYTKIKAVYKSLWKITKANNGKKCIPCELEFTFCMQPYEVVIFEKDIYQNGEATIKTPFKSLHCLNYKIIKDN